ncbi:P-loop containing nucleoside triphosphate hydrolase protein [Sordaria sp. MPI-SDFR-AT-0083]|nr:P-loop containing nucleoside triphosphate hydrolase protein [Sordaria sp. MPI-SDFR-AT-0083]
MDLDPQEDNPVEMNVDRDGNSHDSDNESFKSAIDEPFDLRELYQDALEEPSEELSDQVSSPAALTARAYQLEMFEASLRQNIIVANGWLQMDTGSGKTQVELEQSDKRIWFLVPTVALAHQQHQVLQSQIPSVKTLLICGHDGVDSWSDQAVWDAILLNVRIVVSTYQILSDANAHGFVRLDSLSLIVIDEAHNCSKSHPISRMMTEAYLPAKRAGLPVPSILGLTASPLMSNNLDDIEKLEQVLDAVCRTPTKHREELLEHVNRPEMLVFPYGDSGGPVTEPAPTDLMIRFREAYHGLDIRKDPEVLLLKAQRTERARQKLRHAVTKKDTTAQKEMKGVYNRSILVHKEVGPWAADYYLTRAISQMLAELEHEHSDHFRYIGEALRSIPIPTVSKEPIQLSSKVQTLLRILSSHQEDPVGIVFVQERVMVSIVTHIISTHPLTKDRYRTAAMIGTANVPGRKQHFKDMTNAGDNKSLEGFREGRFNLLVATNVLEEGIDVPICNLVICFDKPSNIKSFIQRRGRARKGSSTLYLMVQDASGESATGWRDLERLMKEKYEDEMRETAELELVEDPRLGSYPVLEVESTGARITIRDVRSHLNHFCAKVSSRSRHLQNEPYFVIRKVDPDPASHERRTLLKATVHLPASVAPDLRRHHSLWTWTSEKLAIMDASFQAYKALYHAGLVNDHLLPTKASDFLADLGSDPGHIWVRTQLDPWPEVAHAWQEGSFLYSRRLTIRVPGMETPLEFAFILPVPVPYMAPLKLWWNATSALELITDSEMQEFCKEGVARAGPDHSYALLAMAFQHRFPLEGKQYPIRLVSTQRKLDVAGIAALEFDPQLYESFTDPPLVRLVEGTPFFVTKVLPSKPPAELVLKPSKEHADLPEDVPYVVYKSLSKAVGQFLPPEAAHEHDNWIPKDGKLYQKVLPSTSIRMDDFPAAFAQVGAVMPAFTRAVEMSLVAADLMYNRLGCLELDNLLLVTTALTSIGSRAPTNYERLEFLGDTILKFCACLTASALFPNHHERLLSQWKDSLVNNVRLCRASIDFGLDEYIIHSMASKKWRPKFVENYLDDSKSPKSAETREMSSKMVADVIESLIGATYMCGDMSKALECIALLLPTSKSSKFKWQDIGLSRDKLFELAPNDAVLHKQLEPLEKAMGYAFTKKSLLIEAMTHPSCPGLGDNDSCYERLEFLGDAILDVIVVKRLMAETGPNELAHNDMHEYLSSVVTADIMAFLAMEWVIARTDTVEIDPARLDAIDSLPFSKHTKITPANLVSNTEDWAFWRFMRHNSSHVASAQTVTQERYLTLRDDIRTAIWEKHELPWALLARMGPQKFYSDIVESLVGAVWVDSGSWEVCEHVLNQMGLLPLLDHLIRTKAHVMHPNVELHILAPPSKRETRTEFVIISNKRGIISHGTEFADETNAVDDGLVKVEPYHDDDVPTQGEVFSCKLFVGGKQVADVTGAGTKEEARVRAAEKGCLVIKAERRKAMAENKAVDGAAVADNEGSSQDADGDTVMD